MTHWQQQALRRHEACQEPEDDEGHVIVSESSEVSRKAAEWLVALETVLETEQGA